MPPHFHHLIQWQDLMWCCLLPTSGSSNPVTLPTGPSCHKIHIRRRRDELVVQHHSYLQPSVCRDPKCVSSSSNSSSSISLVSQDIPRSFLKGQAIKYKVYFGKSGCWNRTRTDQPVDVILLRLDSFFQSVFYALEEVGQADLQRQHHVPYVSIEQMIQDIRSSPDYNSFWSDGNCEMVYQLLLRHRPDLVLEGHRRKMWNLQETFCTQFGGQAVGNFWRFLLHHVVTVYVDTNLYLAAMDANMETLNFPLSPSNEVLWGDCDGRSFLHPWRFALQDGVYLKDGNATMDMLRGCFRFLASLYIVLESCEPRPNIHLSEYFGNSLGMRCGGNASWLFCDYE